MSSTRRRRLRDKPAKASEANSVSTKGSDHERAVESRDPRQQDIRFFICDDAALDVLRPVVIEMGWQRKVPQGGLRNAVQSLSITASPTS
jgi:hypothetical protein